MDAAPTLPFRCACEQIAGSVRDTLPGRTTFVICHCSSCQAFARHFSAEKRILGDADGTELLQIPCASLRLDRGVDKLGCIHLTNKPTLRWYATCCDTPLFNSYKNARWPYITVLLANTEESARPPFVARPAGHLFLSNTDKPTAHLRAAFVPQLVGGVVKRMVRDVLSGDRKRTALFARETFAPIATPRRVGKTGDIS